MAYNLIKMKRLIIVVIVCTGLNLTSAQHVCYDFTPEDRALADDTCSSSIRDVCEGHGHEFTYGNNTGEMSTCGGCFCCQKKDCYPTTSNQYQGTYNHEMYGRLCQRWDSQFPHSHGNTDPSRFPDETLYEAHNYCRDPDGEGFPWCYTVDPNIRWDRCDIPNCDELAQRNSAAGDCYVYTEEDLSSGLSEEEACLSYPHHVYTGGKNDQFPGCGSCTCCKVKGCYGNNVMLYNGTWSRTESGRTCQRWDSNYPHSHSFKNAAHFPMDGSASAAHNYCRDAGNDEGFLWCYTTDTSRRWERCNVPQDPECDLSDSLEKLSRPIEVRYPAFSVYMEQEPADLDEPLALNYDSILLQGASSYQTDTGHFRAPVDGVYLLTWSAFSSNDQETNLELVVVWNGQPVQYTAAVAEGFLAQASQGVNTVISHLKQGTEAYIRANQGADIVAGVTIQNTSHHLTTFSGSLLYPDTAPNVAFSVFLEGGNSTSSTILFNTIILNDGQGYCAETGHFKVPTDGIFLFTYVVGTIGTEECDVNVMIDGARYTSSVTEGTNVSEDMQGGNTLITRLSAGSEVWLDVRTQGSVDSSARYTSFSGVQLY